MIIFDLEVSKQNNKILDIGAVTNDDKTFHNSSLTDFKRFIKKVKPRFFVGHNVIRFDLKYLSETIIKKYINEDGIIDTLYLSALLFPKKPYHNLVKDDKLVSDYANNPFNDAIKSKNLFFDALNQFKNHNETFQEILYYLLSHSIGFKGFFDYMAYNPIIDSTRFIKNLQQLFGHSMCFNKNITDLVSKYRIEFAFALSYIYTEDTKESLLPAWILNTFPKVEDILTYLRATNCQHTNCEYCTTKLSSVSALRKYFSYEQFREFDGVKLQEEAVNSAINNQSLIAVFPTGGGKSLTFQLPALVHGENIGGLTVVISPLQSLMKDQVDNLLNKNITNAAYMNGLLNPIERKDVIERVYSGDVNILYISPEALRSRTILNLLTKRQIVRFVIDEAHCFSTWGHDFRPDYLYIADFIKTLVERKQITRMIPVSCFTATAKYDVIKDIKDYFKDKLNLDLTVFKTTKGRTNLEYKVIQIGEDEDRYIALRNILEAHKIPTIIYASRTQVIDSLYEKLINDGFKTSKFHGGMDTEDKINQQNKFMSDETNIMVSTNAFGMGVDKSDVGVVVHYNISDSLENYIQEAGRAGRDEKLKAKCYILFSVKDLDKHFELLNFSKVSRKEIGQVWTGIKRELKTNEYFSKSTLELAKLSGWDASEISYDNKVKTSILTLEDSNFIKRGLNVPRVFATSLLVLSMVEAVKIIDKSDVIAPDQKETTKRLVKSLISNKRKSWADEMAESRVDHLADNLGMDKAEVITHINYLREIGILADASDLYAKINQDTKLRTLQIEINRYKEIIDYLIDHFSVEKKQYNVKALNEALETNYKPDIRKLKKVISYLSLSGFIKTENIYKDGIFAALNQPSNLIKESVLKLFNISEFVAKYLVHKYNHKSELKTKSLIDFSPLELIHAYKKELGLISEDIAIKDIEQAILMMQRLDIIAFEGGFLVSYSPMTITRIEANNNARFTIENYEKLDNHYKIKNQQIHIVGTYAELMHKDKAAADLLVSDYFTLKYSDFLDKYFPGQAKKSLDLKMSKSRYQKLFGKLSDEQTAVILDSKSKIIGVSAGPGSGKTMLLVHKLASIIFNEDVKTNQLLMLTFSRNAAVEFKERLRELIGNVSNYIQITTFHSYAFDILGKQGSIEKSENIVKEAVEAILTKTAELQKITKTMVVIDEAQDMSLHEYELVQALIDFNDDIRVIAVGDDDQNIYEFRGSSSSYLQKFTEYKKYELTINYRSQSNIVKYANSIVHLIKNRIKEKEIISNHQDPGVVEVITYSQDNMYIPLINKLNSDRLPGKTAIITRTNEEALLISGLLTQQKITNTLISNSKTTKAYNFYELRLFYEMLAQKSEIKIDIKNWYETLKKFENKYKQSTNLELYLNVLNKFIEVYNDAYLSDLKEYLNEIDLTYFKNDGGIMVSNLHKVKGMEFDNVYLLYDKPGFLEDEEIRNVYVGLTRTKNHLSIHTKNNIFNRMTNNQSVKLLYDHNTYQEPSVIELELNYNDIYLGYYAFVQHNVKRLFVGDQLSIDEQYKFIHNGKKVGSLSSKGKNIVEDRIRRGYKLSDIEVLDLMCWYNKEKAENTVVMIPKIKFILEK